MDSSWSVHGQSIEVRWSLGGEGLAGGACEAPCDLMLGAAAPERLPAKLLEQLAPGGTLILPVGGKQQQLMMVTATPEGYVEEVIEEVNFSQWCEV